MGALSLVLLLLVVLASAIVLLSPTAHNVIRKQTVISKTNGRQGDNTEQKIQQHVVLAAPSIPPLIKHELSAFPQARCLDGSPGAYYYRPGSGSGKDKWYVFHQGGGWCGPTIDNCLARSKTDLGSSKSYPSTKAYAGEFFSTDRGTNPLTYDWNQVHMNYCDGGSFAGDNATETWVDDDDSNSDYLDDDNSDGTTTNRTRLYFAGKHILKAVQDDLKNRYGLKDATDLVVSGCSAGGLAAFFHCDDWASQIPDTAKVACVPQSGLFLDNNMDTYYPTVMKWTFAQQNISIPTACSHHYALEPFECMFAENVMKYIDTPVFVLQSRFDSWQIGNDLQSHDVDKINAWGNQLTKVLFDNLLLRDVKHGAYVDSCLHHCGGWDLVIDGATAIQATSQWYENSTATGAQLVWLQDRAYPNMCASLDDVGEIMKTS